MAGRLFSATHHGGPRHYQSHLTTPAPSRPRGAPPMCWTLTLLLKFTDLPFKMGPDLLQAGLRLANSRHSATTGTMCGQSTAFGVSQCCPHRTHGRMARLGPPCRQRAFVSRRLARLAGRARASWPAHSCLSGVIAICGFLGRLAW